MRFGTLNVKSLYRSGSLMTVVRELARYKLYVNNSKSIQPFSHIFWFTLFFKTLHVSAIIRCFNNTRVKGTQIYKGFQAK